jgi:hypothetical protein
MLRYTNIDEAIKLARLKGMTTIQIVRAITGAAPYPTDDEAIDGVVNEDRQTLER